MPIFLILLVFIIIIIIIIIMILQYTRLIKNKYLNVTERTLVT